MKKIKKLIIFLIIVLISGIHVVSYAVGAAASKPGYELPNGGGMGGSGAAQQAEEAQRVEKERQELLKKQQLQQPTTPTQPTTPSTGTSDITSIINPNDYKPDTLTQEDSKEFIDIVGSILGALRVFGIAVSVIALMVLGVRYMLGSASEKATYKETMVPYIVGAVMVLVIPTIVQIIFELITGITI